MHETGVEEVVLRGLLVRASEATEQRRLQASADDYSQENVIRDTGQKTRLDAPLLMQLELNWIVSATLLSLINSSAFYLLRSSCMRTQPTNYPIHWKLVKSIVGILLLHIITYYYYYYYYYSIIIMIIIIVVFVIIVISSTNSSSISSSRSTSSSTIVLLHHHLHELTAEA